MFTLRIDLHAGTVRNFDPFHVLYRLSLFGVAEEGSVGEKRRGGVLIVVFAEREVFCVPFLRIASFSE